MDFYLKPCVTIVPKKESLYNSGNSGRNYKCRNYNQKCRICVVMVVILQPLIKQLQPTCLLALIDGEIIFQKLVKSTRHLSMLEP
mgnify:CR=1 FL=1